MPEDALELKKNLRCDMKARRNALTDEEKKHAAANCLSKLKELPEFMNADWIYAYIACRNAPRTTNFRCGEPVSSESTVRRSERNASAR